MKRIYIVVKRFVLHKPIHRSVSCPTLPPFKSEMKSMYCITRFYRGENQFHNSFTAHKRKLFENWNKIGYSCILCCLQSLVFLVAKESKDHSPFWLTEAGGFSQGLLPPCMHKNTIKNFPIIFVALQDMHLQYLHVKSCNDLESLYRRYMCTDFTI